MNRVADLMDEKELEHALQNALQQMKAGLNTQGFDPRFEAQAYASGLMLFSHKRLTKATYGLILATLGLVFVTAVLAIVTYLRH